MHTSSEDRYFTLLCETFSKDNVVGWVSADGDIHPVSLHCHLEFFIEGGSWDIPGIEESLIEPAREHRQSQEQDWAEQYYRGRRQWHEFDPTSFEPEWSQQRDAYDAIYRAGWGRIGRFAGVIEIQCYEEFANVLAAAVDDVATVVGCEVKVEVVSTSDYTP